MNIVFFLPIKICFLPKPSRTEDSKYILCSLSIDDKKCIPTSISGHVRYECKFLFES